MKIAVAQTRPVTGDLHANIAHHKQWIERAIADTVDLLIFPELSLTGYEPTLASALAMTPDDSRLEDFQVLSDTHGITIGVGVPTKQGEGICISLLLFQPHQIRYVYSKSYLHPDEEAFFVPGHSTPHLQVKHTNIALAICYELSVSQHLKSALTCGPSVYIASVAKFVNGINAATERLSGIARTCAMPVMLANCIGVADGGQGAGKTSVWNDHGILIGQLNDTEEGMLIFDTASQTLVVR